MSSSAVCLTLCNPTLAPSAAASASLWELMRVTKGPMNVDWFALPSSDHPFIPQNVYRMSGGATNNERFEQIGQSWGKHAFAAASSNSCGFGCNGVGGDHLGSGCSDAYGAGLNGSQGGIGSRAWVNPFTGSFNGSTANNHSGHSHDVTSHRMLVDVNDLNTSLNPGATYFAEAEYIVPHEGTWCQSHPDQCNMYNNASYRPYTVTGINQPFSFTAAGPTVREHPAIMAWTGATVNQIEPDHGNDGIWFMGYKVTNPTTGVWHYEYALYNQNLDRSIQSFSVPVGPGVNISNIGFHAPIQHPGWANDGTLNILGYSSTPWNVTQDASSITWSTETFAQNQNANAIRFGTLYNFRFDADQPPNPTNATVGYFKTGSPTFVGVQAAGNVPLPSPTPTPTASPSPTSTATPTPTPIPCAGLTIIQISGSIVPGTTDIGNHGDDYGNHRRAALPFHLVRPDLHLDQSVVQRQCPVHDYRYGLHQPMPAVDHPQLHDLPVLGRSVFGQQWVWHIHIDKWHCTQSHLQHRVAGAVFPGERQCQLRAEVV